MRIGVLGTGVVGQTLATRLAELGHEVVMGSRDPANEKAVAWADRTGGRAGSFADAASHGEVVVNATGGVNSVAALSAAGAANLAGKVVLDVANPLDFSGGMPPSLSVANTDSLAETIQREFPSARVVKALNTVNAGVMVDPAMLAGEHHLPIAGDEPAAKATVTGLLRQLGWRTEWIIDLGGIAAARAMEMYVPLWVHLMQAIGTPEFNIRVVTR